MQAVSSTLFNAEVGSSCSGAGRTLSQPFQSIILSVSLIYLCVCTGYILSLVLLTLPRQHLVKLYLYVLTALLLFAGHQVSR